MNDSTSINRLEAKLLQIYLNNTHKLPFHGWHHIIFVRDYALIAASSLNANKFLVEVAALTHDLNYLVGKFSEPELGFSLRKQILGDIGFPTVVIEKIELIINQANGSTRNSTICKEAMALSDGDTLFKALPITPILFARDYLTENGIDLLTLARKVVKEQKPLLEQNIYFYSEELESKFIHWARTNLTLWENVLLSLQDQNVQKLLSNSQYSQLIPEAELI